MKIPNYASRQRQPSVSLARIVSEDSQHLAGQYDNLDKSSKDS